MRLMAERRQPFYYGCQSHYTRSLYRDSCIPLHTVPIGKCCVWGKGFVYNVALVQKLCADIAAEKDPQKAEDLLSLLQAVIRENQEEVRDRMAFIAKNYADVISETKAAD